MKSKVNIIALFLLEDLNKNVCCCLLLCMGVPILEKERKKIGIVFN